jgi:hypothetical protein
MEAPWTPEQVLSLNRFQASGVYHPFTSAAGKELLATAAGWVEVEGGPVVQTWAHEFMLDGSWQAMGLGVR